MAHPPNSENAPFSKSSNNPGSTSPFEFYILSLFPEVFPSVLSSSLMGKAQEKGLVQFRFLQIRDFATDKHRTVDDTPYGGGEGMVMRADVLYAAWNAALKLAENSPTRSPKPLTIFLSPQGPLLTQDRAKELASLSSRKVILICGHYEGLDERFIERCVDLELSIGDYVLTGGELPAMVVIDAVTRLLPGVVGNERSITEDSLEGGLLKYPQYTRPRSWAPEPGEPIEVPPVLLGGNHGEIQKWRKAQMLARTEKKRPDLWSLVKRTLFK